MKILDYLFHIFCRSEGMTILPKLSSLGQGQGHWNKKLAKICRFFFFLIFEVIFPQFMILPLYLVFINNILMPLKYKYIAPTKYLQGQGHLTSVFVF